MIFDKKAAQEIFVDEASEREINNPNPCILL